MNTTPLTLPSLEEITSLSINDRLQLISSLEFGQPHPSLVAAIKKSGKKSFALAANGTAANVDAGSIVAFTAGVSPDHTTAALNTTLLAQLHADTVADRNKASDVMTWYQAYQNVMGLCGWTIQNFQFQNFQAAGSTFSINTAIAGIVAAFMAGPEVAVVNAALTALSNLQPHDPWYKVWDSHTHSADGGNFQIAAASDAAGAKNTLALKISAYTFTTTETFTRFLWENFTSSDTTLSYAGQTMVLNETIYGGVSAQIVSKLGTNASAQIGALSI